MPRLHGRVFCSIWNDEDFRKLTADTQRLFMIALSQSTVSGCGVLPMQISKWSKYACDTDYQMIERALIEADDAGFLIIDQDTEEVLIRSLVRRDEVWKIPNVLKGALRAARAVESQHLRRVLAVELRRLAGMGLKIDNEAVEAAAADLDPDPSPTSPEPFGKGSATLPEGFDKGSEGVREPSTDSNGRPESVFAGQRAVTSVDAEGFRKGSANPSGRVRGGGGGEGVVTPRRTTTFNQKRAPRERTHTRGRARPADLAATAHSGRAHTLVAAYAAACPVLPPASIRRKLAVHVDELVAAGWTDELITGALALWRDKGLDPSVFPSVANEHANRRPLTAVADTRPSTTDARVAAALDLARHYAQQEAAQPPALRRIGGVA